MRQRGVFIHKDGALVPQTDRERELLAKLKEGERVMVHVHRARYPEHHRLVWAVVDKLAEATGYAPYAIYVHLKKETGYVEWTSMPDGTLFPIPMSMSFESMGQDEFSEWWKYADVMIKEQFLPKIPQKYYEEIRDIMTGKDTRGEAA